LILSAKEPVAMNEKRTSLLQLGFIIGLVIAIIAIVFLVNQNKQKDQEIADLEQRVNVINRNLVEQQRMHQSTTELLRMFESEEYKKIRLASVSGKPKATVLVFWNVTTKEVLVTNISLPLPPASKKYHLWTLIDGQYVNSGVLENSRYMVQKMNSFPKAEAFAISLERNGSNKAPTEIYLTGKAS
jgi:hypothetical protein